MFKVLKIDIIYYSYTIYIIFIVIFLKPMLQFYLTKATNEVTLIKI